MHWFSEAFQMLCGTSCVNPVSSNQRLSKSLSNPAKPLSSHDLPRWCRLTALFSSVFHGPFRRRSIAPKYKSVSAPSQWQNQSPDQWLTAWSTCSIQLERSYRVQDPIEDEAATPVEETEPLVVEGQPA